MKTIQPGMNVPRQRRKISHLAENAPDEFHARYLGNLLDMFDASVAAGQPRPASEFLPMYHEEFDIPTKGETS